MVGLSRISWELNGFVIRIGMIDENDGFFFGEYRYTSRKLKRQECNKDD